MHYCNLYLFFPFDTYTSDKNKFINKNVVLKINTRKSIAREKKNINGFFFLVTWAAKTI